MLNIETKELKISDKLKRKIEMIGRFTNTIINNGCVKNITGCKCCLCYATFSLDIFSTFFCHSVRFWKTLYNDSFVQFFYSS